MEPIEEPWDDDTVIDMDLWLRVLLEMTGDKDVKAKLVKTISENTGQPPEQIERIIAATITYMSNQTRSN